MRMCENTIKDLGTLNRGQSMLLNLYIKGYTHVTLAVYLGTIELTVFAPKQNDLSVAEMIIRDLMGDGDSIECKELKNDDGPFATIQWIGHLIETEIE